MQAQTRRLLIPLLLLGVFVAAASAYAASKKKAGEKCEENSECAGHCHEKKNGDEVCVNCSSSSIANARSRVDKFCKIKRKCLDQPATEEVSQAHIEELIERGDNCIRARNDENRTAGMAATRVTKRR